MTGARLTFPGGCLYHTTKWGIEGFIDSIRYELAPFNIAVTIVEPGSTGTNFSTNLIVADALDAYADTPVGQVRSFFGGGTGAPPSLGCHAGSGIWSGFSGQMALPRRRPREVSPWPAIAAASGLSPLLIMHALKLEIGDSLKFASIGNA